MKRALQRAFALSLPMMAGSVAIAQTSAPALRFEVASIHESTLDGRPFSNFPLGPGTMYAATGGVFHARSQTLLTYIAFAYKLNNNQLQALQKGVPAWVTTAAYNIEAHAEMPRPTKDQMRLMMQSLLAERFHLAIHMEPTEMAVYDLVLIRPDHLGPKLRKHDSAVSCDMPLGNEELADGYPASCGGLALLPAANPGSIRVGARNVSLEYLANALPGWGVLSRPVINKTGLSENIDFVVEFRREGDSVAGQPESEERTASFAQAFGEQLGLKLVRDKGAVELLRLDHVERPSEN